MQASSGGGWRRHALHCDCSAVVSGAVNGIQFKRSVIENIDISEEQAREVCQLMQKLIEAKEKRASQAST